MRLVKGVKNAPKAKVSQSNRGRRRKPSRKPQNNKQSKATSRKVGPDAKEGGYTISEKARKAAKNLTTKPSQPANSSQTSQPAKPTRKREQPQTTGVGPVKSGRSYSVNVTGKSVTQQRVDELRQMQERSRKRQAEQRKSIEEAKKKREQQQQQKHKRTSR